MRRRTNEADEWVGTPSGGTVEVAVKDNGDADNDDALLTERLWARSGLVNFLKGLQSVGGNVVVKVNYNGQVRND